MNFNMNFPVNIVSGIGCIKSNKKLLCMGKRAFIVCGKSGAKKSGALDDVIEALTELGIKYDIYDKSVENPPIMMCYEGGKLCREVGADFVIGIGGGSALDAAKAVALYAVHPSFEPEDVFDLSLRENRPLPLVAIPTTSGTGSEANGTSVMSLPDGLRKKSFATAFPCVSFLDPQYTYSLPMKSSVSCALDAFAHACESYLSPKSNDVSRIFAVYAAKSIWSIIKNVPESFTPSDRQVLQNAATAAGLAISVTGTGAPHPLGYSLTMLDGIAHGAACAVFYRHYLFGNYKTERGRELLDELCATLGTDVETLAETITGLSGVKLSLTESEINERVSLISGAKNYQNSPYVMSDDEKLATYRELFSK